MSLLKEIRQQPEHIRCVIMWLCVVTTFSLVSFVWFKSTQTRFVAMLNSNQIREDIDPRRFVERPSDDLGRLAMSGSEFSDKSIVVSGRSLFTSISDTFSLLKASIIDLIGSSQKELEINKEGPIEKRKSRSGLEVKTLPLSGDK